MLACVLPFRTDYSTLGYATGLVFTPNHDWLDTGDDNCGLSGVMVSSVKSYVPLQAIYIFAREAP